MKKRKKKISFQYNLIFILLSGCIFSVSSLHYEYKIKEEGKNIEKDAGRLMDNYIEKTAQDLRKNSERYYEYGVIDRSEFDHLLTKKGENWQVYKTLKRAWDRVDIGEAGEVFSEESQGIVFFNDRYYIYGGVSKGTKPVFSLWEIDQNYFDIFSRDTGIDIKESGEGGKYIFKSQNGDDNFSIYFSSKHSSIWEYSLLGIYFIMLVLLIFSFSYISRKKLEALEERILEDIITIHGSRGKKKLKIEGESIFSKMRESLMELGDSFYKKSSEVCKLKGKLARTNLELRELAIIDKLTGLYNKMFLYEMLNGLKKERVDLPYHHIIMMIDLDNFKKLNDTSGHLAGDLLLQELGEVLKSIGRKWGTAFRYGGDEFFIVFKRIRYEEFLDVVAGFEIRKKEIMGRYLHVRLGVSTGAMILDQSEDYEPDAIIKEVDKLLYEAKTNGKNQIVFKI